MLALSLWQPWASLIAIGAKQYETRSWSTPYRGKLAIHAAKHFTDEEAELCHEEPFRSALIEGHITKISMLPLGFIVCEATLVDVIPTHKVDPDSDEEAFGNFEPGRYAWKLENIIQYDVPIRAKGAQGLWEWRR